MKKTLTLFITVITVLALAAVSTGLTLAYFSDKDTADTAGVSAGYVQVAVSLELARFGVPSDTLLLATEKNPTTERSTVTVKNTSQVPVTYELSLTVDKGTAELLEETTGDDAPKQGVALFYDGNTPLALKSEPTANEESVTYVFESVERLDGGASDVLDLALTFKGEDLYSALKDGNAYQKAPINVRATVLATQVVESESGGDPGAGGSEG